MKSIKQAYKYVALFLVLSMILGSMVVFADTSLPNDVSNVQSFSDVLTDHWAYEYIEELVKRGAITGYPDGKFRPDLTVTRAEFAKIMVKAADLTLKTVTTSSFADIKKTDWYSPYVEAAKGYMTGYRDQTGKTIFRPNSAALREDIVVAIVKLKGYDVRFADVRMLEVMYKDYSSISASARSYVAIAVEKGLISGFPDETFRAQATITRAQVATILWRAFQYGNDDKVTGDDITEPSTSDTEEPSTTGEDATASDEEDAVKYGVNTLLSTVAEPDYMITDNDGVVYILINNQIKKIVDGQAVLIADGNKDFKQKIETGHIASEILRTNNDIDYWDTQYMTEALDDTELVTYNNFDINSLLLDSKLNKVYCVGIYSYNGDTNVNCKGIRQIAVYDANDKNNPTASFFYFASFCEKFNGTGFLVNNAVVNNAFLFSSNRQVFRYDLINNNVTVYAYSNYLDVIKFGYTASAIINSQYVFMDTGITICRHDMIKGDMKAKNYNTYDVTGSITTITSGNGYFYVMAGPNVYTVDVNGELSEYIKGSDLVIQDDLPIGIATRMAVDKNGNIIFYDATNRSIRKISL